jgi:hypothetical protein
MIARDHTMPLISVRFPRLLCASIVVAIAACAAAAAAQDVTGTGTVIAAAPVYLLPDASRIPLATLAAGETVRVVGRENQWYRVVFHDVRWGDRTGYMLATNLRVDPSAAPPPRGAAPPTAQPPTQPASARAERPREPVGFVSLNGAYQGTSTSFSAATTFVQNAETGNVSTNYGGGHPPVIDVGGAGRIWHALGLIVAATWSRENAAGSVSADVPHPFLFNAPRHVEGVADELDRREISFHLDPAVIVPFGRRTQVAVFAGPSYFRVRQGLVTGVTVTDVYPYDTATFASATTVEATKSRVGYNAGIDFAVALSRSAGVGILIRYSRADLTFDAPEGGSPVDTQAGGLQVGGGLRFRF